MSANGCLGLKGLEPIQRKVEADFGLDPSGVNVISVHASDSRVRVKHGGEGESSGGQDDRPRYERPASDEYKNLLLRAKIIFDEFLD